MSNAQRSNQEQSPFAFTLADRLDKALRVTGIHPDEMAEALGVSPNTVGNYRSGRTTPSRLQVKEWAVRTGAPLEWLIEGDAPKLHTKDYKYADSDPNVCTLTDLAAYRESRSGHAKAPIAQAR